MPNIDALRQFRSLLARTPFSQTRLLRGYRSGQFGGRYFFVSNMEYRIPLADTDRGLGTLPMFMRRISAWRGYPKDSSTIP